MFGFFLLAVIVALCLLIASVRRSSLGRQMLAVRSNERAAAAAGVNVTVVKLIGFGLAALIAGAAGVMYSYEFGGVSAGRFGAFAALGLIAFAYVGGITMISGAFFAGLISTSGLVSYALDKWFGLSGNWALLFAGVALIVTLIMNPEGVAGANYKKAQQRKKRQAGPGGRDRCSRGDVVTTTGSFPNPYEIETPPGCEGWEEMYPYYAVFDERRRETDEQRFWFWNSMHFPVPMPAFDVACVDVPYQGIGTWQNRVFAVPPAMGIDYRVVNGYVYISGNPVTDPEKIAERAEFFQKRAGYYFENWDELYAKWKVKMEALIAEVTELRVPDLLEYEPDEVVFEDGRDTAYVEVLEAYGRLLRCGELMWQHHSEFLLLGYGAYATFVDFCKNSLPDIPDQHIAQMVAGIDVLLFKPDAELKRLARLALETGVDSAFVEGRSPEEIDDELAQSEAGRAWLEELEQVKDPWFNMATGDGLYHYYGSWLDDPSIPYASLVGYVGALKRGRGGRPADRGARTRAGPARGGIRCPPRRGRAQGLRRAARPLAHGLPVCRRAQVPLRLLVPHEMVEQGARVRCATRDARLPRGCRRRLPALPERGRKRPSTSSS